MPIAPELLERANKERPPFVSFERRPIEDPVASRQAGQYVAKDIDFAKITPLGSKDVFITPVTEWFEQLKVDVLNGRIYPQWVDQFKDDYEHFKRGQEPPLHGTPIRGWNVISPAQQETLVHMNIMTVEDLAAINDEGIKRVGMGSIDLKNRAAAWLLQMKDKGPATIKIAELEKENALLKANLSSLSQTVDDLKRAIEIKQDVPVHREAREEIAAADIIDAEPTHDELVAAYTTKHGKAPHHRMKDETIKASL